LRAALAFVLLSLSPAVSFAASASPTTSSAAPQLMYLGVWPHTVLVMDAMQGKIIDKINLPTDIARVLVLSPDKTMLYGSTVRDNAIVSINLATRKVTDSFLLNTADTNYRLSGLAIDPTGKELYSVATPIIKKIDHYDVQTPEFVRIDLAARKITQMVPFPKDETAPNAYRRSMKVSPDGKLLYLFGEKIQVFNTSDFKPVKTIELAKTTDPSTDQLSLSPTNDPNESVGKLTGIFETSDPYVHRRIFGIADVDLSNMSYDLTPVGPADASMQPMMLTPDKKLGYTVAVFGTHGDRITEFWVFDMATKKIINRKQFLGRTRLNFGMSADGTKLMIYNAGFQIELYDAKTLELEKTIDLEGDTTSNLIVMPYGKAS
jgi:DNA-binding beta-propeller fold protein YncE